MSFGLFTLFSVSLGPSSSHSIAPMRAGQKFIQTLLKENKLQSVEHIFIDFYGSLAINGKANGADIACIAGLLGMQIENNDVQQIKAASVEVKQQGSLVLQQQHHVKFDWQQQIRFHQTEQLEKHLNGLCITAKGNNDAILLQNYYYSIGNGLVLEDGETNALPSVSLPFAYTSMAQLIAICQQEQKSIAEICFCNELARLQQDSPEATREMLDEKIDSLWQVMKQSIKQGIQHFDPLPGAIQIKRRAPYLHQQIKNQLHDKKTIENEDWVNLFAIAISEENAAGGKIISAPSNGSAGVIAAVIAYYNKFMADDNKRAIRDFIATAAAIGALYKTNSSINAAQLGCQGEVGVACSMAAAGLAAAKGANLFQIENAAQIALEHNIGLTCNPLGGLVQAPCIERNSMAAMKAINATRVAMTQNEPYVMSLDERIKTLNESGLNMLNQYKENVIGAESILRIPVNIISC